jgi:hypothetical protein
MWDEFELPQLPDVVACPYCAGIGTCYGLAPHTHYMTRDSISTTLDSKDKWPDNFHEDPEVPGCGVWVCGLCEGLGTVELPIEIATDDKNLGERYEDFGEKVDVVLLEYLQGVGET